MWKTTVELQGLETFGTIKICLRQGWFELISVNHSQVRRHNKDIFSIFYNMEVYCVFSLESPH